jgi:hypothetical protein
MPRKAKAATAPAVDPKLVAAVDSLGQCRSALAPLLEQEKALKEILMSAGMDEIQGRGYVCKITTSTRATVDVAALRKRCGPDFVAENTSMSTVRSIRVSARADVVAAALKLAA